MTKNILSLKTLESLQKGSKEEELSFLYNSIVKECRSGGLNLIPVAIFQETFKAINETGKLFEAKYNIKDGKVNIIDVSPFSGSAVSAVEKILAGTFHYEDIVFAAQSEQEEHCELLDTIETLANNSKTLEFIQSNRTNIVECAFAKTFLLKKDSFSFKYIYEGKHLDSYADYKGLAIDKIRDLGKVFEDIYTKLVKESLVIHQQKEKIKELTTENCCKNILKFSENLVEEVGIVKDLLTKETFENIKVTQLAKIHDRIVSIKHNYELGVCLVAELKDKYE